MKTLTQEWLKAAHDDLETIEQIVQQEHLTNVAAFHAQQAVEKCLKALLEEQGVEFPKTHDLLRLQKLLLSDAIQLDINQAMLRRLNLLYIDSRYPGEFGLLPNGKPTLADAREFYQFAQGIYTTVCARLKDSEEDQLPHLTDENDAIREAE
ncbi:MAG: HEPN domain-containing protein [Candidatus Vecturithrix sp.]|jgi:HEPN domain-containing protein|nr:HEPN domain-containing protein [Candidatus Vecturithrix sp.]